jgi:hypothetical protein
VNLVPTQYRNVSVAEVATGLDEASLRAHLMGRPVYRRTQYLVARRGDACAVAEVSKESQQPLFSPVTGVALIAGAEETAFVDAPETDTGVPTQLARVAARCAPHARCVVVRGRYGHVSFIADPAPARIRVVEVVPPRPAKLVDQLTRVLDVAEDLPPVELVPDLVDLAELAASRPAEHYLFPCRAGGRPVGAGAERGRAPGGGGRAVGAGAERGGGKSRARGREEQSAGEGKAERGDGTGRAPGVSYLDEVPPRRPWTLVGCARSRAIHDWFYGGPVDTVDMCPRALAGPGPVLTKCCLLEDRVAVDGGVVVVPWGASLAQVKEGLQRALEAVTEPVAHAAGGGPNAAASRRRGPASHSADLRASGTTMRSAREGGK